MKAGTIIFISALAAQVAFAQPKVLTRTPTEPWWPRDNVALAHIVGGDGSWSVSSLANTARAKDLLVFWGTGFRSATDLEVIAGNHPAKILYAGPSGCCAALDQVVIEAPAGIEGCFVPIWFRLPNSGQTDQVSVAISPAGGRCRDLPPDVIDKLDASHGLYMGFLSISTGVAAFGHAPFLGPAPMGNCRLGGVPPGHIELTYGDFNHSMVTTALNVIGPQGRSVWPWSWGGMYLRDDFGRTSSETRTPAGEYSVDNGEGAYSFVQGAVTQIKFKTDFSVPDIEFTWTNRDSLSHIRRGEGARVTWTGGDPARGFVVMFGEGFTCFEDVRKGGFEIPSYVLRSAGITGQLRLTVAFQADSSRLSFPIPGFDFAFASYHIGSTQTVKID